MIKEPFLTEDGFVNEACLNELEGVLKNISPVYERCFGDEEWNKKVFTNKKEITGSFAYWAVELSPYPHPEGLEGVVGYLDACLDKSVHWEINHGGFHQWAYLSLNDISKLLYDILYEQGFELFNNWNISKNNKKNNTKQKTVFSSAFSKPLDPDCEFIDLDALLTNTTVSIRDERRIFDRFNEEFEEEWDAKEKGESDAEDYPKRI
jgi:hypothetical protein